MQTSKRILDDLAKVASGTASVFSGLKDEVETLVRQRIEHVLADLDLVPRDEFEAVKAVAAKARSEQEKLAKKVASLETLLDVKTGGRAGSKGKSDTAKPAAQSKKTSRSPARPKK